MPKPSILLLLAFALVPRAVGSEPLTHPVAPALEVLVEEVHGALAAGDPDRALGRVEALRDHGPAAVEALADRFALSPLRLADDLFDPALAATAGDLLDRVCAQRSCAASRLFWHTDLDAALAAAEATGKPILSLRLLGRLDEELSCANSRYFRVLLYADPEISELLRDQFVLHWRSMRPAPKVTVELGDGRRLERTLTGNSVHYVLDRRGRLVDALPGLYAPAAFRRFVDELGAEARTAGQLDGDAFARWRSRRAGELIRTISRSRDRELARTDGAAPAPRRVDLRDVRTVTKAGISNPVLDALRPVSRPAGPWHRLAHRFRDDARLAAESRRRVARMQDLAGFAAAEETAGGPDLLEERLVSTLQADLAADTALNHFYLRPDLIVAIAAGMAEALTPHDFDRWVYAAIFGDPGDDPWLGLAAPEAFAALPGGGRLPSR